MNKTPAVQESNTVTTSYTYDNVGNLQSVTYPNGVVHTYGYDNRNRLTNLGVAKGTNQLAGYSYLLDASGHRLSVTELSGRTVNYAYDNLYRLTNETIAADPSGVNGAVNYTYDPVGNRKQLTSTLSPVPAGLWNYNANDQLTSDTYDNNGNTASSGGLSYVYDFENRLVQRGGLSVVYDGDGNRVSKTTANGTTKYLVDDLNPTGYAQVLDELQGGNVVRTYNYGLELISEQFPTGSPLSTTHTPIYYVLDGHGSVRALTSSTGTLTDTYDYDAFGILVHSTGSTPNSYLYSGEQFDPDLNLYYNRARDLNVSTGRFRSMDTFQGAAFDPQSLHRFLYAGDDAVNRSDPTGNLFASNLAYGRIVHEKIGDDCEARYPECVSDTSVKRILAINIPGGLLRPDLTDTLYHLVYEIKPVGSEALGIAQVTGYAVALTMLDPNRNIWVPGELYIPPTIIQINSHAIAFVSPPVGGVIIYEVEDLVEIAAIETLAISYQLYTSIATATLITTASAGAY